MLPLVQALLALTSPALRAAPRAVLGRRSPAMMAMGPPPGEPEPKEPPPYRRLIEFVADAWPTGRFAMSSVDGKGENSLTPDGTVEEDMMGVPWYQQGSVYSERSRQYRRTVYMHKEWVNHRSSRRFYRNLQTLGESGVGKALSTELAVVTGTAVFVVVANMLTGSYIDLEGVTHPGCVIVGRRRRWTALLVTLPPNVYCAGFSRRSVSSRLTSA